MRIKKIFLAEDLPTGMEGTSGEKQVSKNETLDYSLLNTDVIVQLYDGNSYKANFITLKKLASEFQAHLKKVDSLAKKYFWSKSMIIVNDIEKEDLIVMIEYMIEEGDFQVIFEKITNDSHDI